MFLSRKMAGVAVRPINLQFFAEEAYPNLEESPEFREDAKEFNAKMDKFMSDRTAKEEQKTEKEPPKETKSESSEDKPVEDKAETPEVAAPEKPRQDSETNKAFQEMRKAREEAERQAREAEDRAKRADALIAEQYGHRGIFTVEQLEAAIEAEKQLETMERYKEAGLTEEEIRKLQRYDELEKETESQKKERLEREWTDKWSQLYRTYPELEESSKAFAEGKEPDWYTAEMKAEIARGASPLAAYRNAHFETILAKKLGETKEVAKQEALDKLNSKEHLAPNATTGGEVDHVEIDEETMRMYRALNKGKSDAEIRKWHKKHAMGG